MYRLNLNVLTPAISNNYQTFYGKVQLLNRIYFYFDEIYSGEHFIKTIILAFLLLTSISLKNITRSYEEG